MTSRALVIGEALIDIVERDGQVLGEHVGGSPLNVAVGLGRLGRDVDFLTHIGDDERGRRIVDYVEASGVATGFGQHHRATARRRRWPRSTTPARRTYDVRHRLAAVRHPRGGAPAGRAHRVDRRRSSIRAAWRRPRCSTPTALSATITYDPNVRPALIDDHEQAIGRIDRLVEKADVVKASDEDLRWIDPNRTPEQIATAWQALGPVDRRGDDGRATARSRSCAAGTVRVRGAPGRGRRHRRRGRLVHDRAHRRAVVAGPARRRPARRPGRASTSTTLEGVLRAGGAGVGADRGPRGRRPARSRRSSTGLSAVSHTGSCVPSGRVPSPSAW